MSVGTELQISTGDFNANSESFIWLNIPTKFSAINVSMPSARCKTQLRICTYSAFTMCSV